MIFSFFIFLLSHDFVLFLQKYYMEGNSMKPIGRLFLTIILAWGMFSGVKADNWMARISDDAYFAQVSIPGTHDAGTGEGFVWGVFVDPYGRTQQLSLSEQWAIGVRAFDLRPAVSSGKLVVFHGILETKISFADAMKLIADSLKQNPSETAVVFIRHEDDNGSDFTTWCQLMRELLDSDFLDGMMADYDPQATLGDMRGKMLLLSRNQYDGTPVGGYITGWTHSSVLSEEQKPRITNGTKTGVLYVQDFYEVTAEGAMTTKLAAIEQILKITTRKHLSALIQQSWAINHASGYTESASTNGIRDNAAQTNKFIIDYMSNPDHYGPTGIIMMDFAGTDVSSGYNTLGAQLVQTIIDNNFRYTPKERETTDIDVIDNGQLTIDNGQWIIDNGAWYTLDGSMLSGIPTKRGVYINNGRKTVIR